MKLLMVTALQEHQDLIADIFRDKGVKAYSASDIQGFSNSDPQTISADNWFGSDDRIPRDSVMVFSFTESEIAGSVLTALKELNEKMDADFPVRAFLLPVEKAL